MRAITVIIGIAGLASGWLAATHLDGRHGGSAPRASLAAGLTRVVGATEALEPAAEAATAPSPSPAPAPSPSPAPAPIVAPAADALADADRLGTFRMTRYYVAEERGFGRDGRPSRADDVDDDNDGFADDGGAELAATLPPEPTPVTIYDDRGCKPIAHLGRRFAEVLDVQGTGRLRDGRVVNISGPCRCPASPCYRTMDDEKRWGVSATSKPLEPFRTVAVDPKVIPLGTVLYIPELDGLTMPGRAPWGGFVHDGCVVASDVGGHIDGQHIDFFVGRFALKRALDARRKMKQVTVYRGGERCAAHRSQSNARGGV